MNCFQNTFLETKELNKIAKSNIFMKKKFLGTYPADILTFEKKAKKKKRCGWIWNTDEQHLPGQHWVAVYKKDRTLYFFDSYGFSPKFYQRQYWQLKKYRFINLTKNIQLQANGTSTCGAWCLLFLYYCFCRNMFPFFLFSSINQIKNEKILFGLIKKIFKQEINKPIERTCRQNQCCTKKK